ncbi:MAG: enoyl-CoA hydratase-related protein [Steroidobacteraceae bacterium]
MSDVKTAPDLRIEDGVAVITFCWPEKLNALNPTVQHEIARIFDELPGNPNVRVIVLTGEGRGFCVGDDLKYVVESGDTELPEMGFAGIGKRGPDYPLPIIGAINGFAMGGGCEIALACDLLIAAEEAVFALPEPKIGWSAITGGVQRLTRDIGIKQALGIVLTGRNVSAAEAKSLGFVNEVVPAAQLMPTAMRWAQQIAECAPLATRCSKQIAYTCLDVPDFATMMREDTYPLARVVYESHDAKEGLRAWVERRKPDWKGN